MKLHRDGNKRTTLRCKLGIQLCKRLRRGSRGRCNCSVSGLAKFRFEATYDWNDAIYGTEMPQKKFAAGRLRECQLSTRVNCAEMIEILLAGWKSQYLQWLGSGLNTEKAVERNFSNAGLHMRITSSKKQLSRYPVGE